MISAFNKVKETYDAHAIIQKKAYKKLESELLLLIKEKNIFSILDIGCGTGFNTYQLSKHFPKSRILGVDSSENLINTASEKFKSEKISFTLIKENNFESIKQKFDLIIINSALHWLGKTETIFPKIYNLLNKDGILAFSYFTNETFKELDLVLKQSNLNIQIPAQKFEQSKNVNSNTEIFFNSLFNETKTSISKNKNLLEILTQIKHTGTKGSDKSFSGLWTKHKINLLDKKYKEIYPNYETSYEIFYFIGQKI